MPAAKSEWLTSLEYYEPEDECMGRKSPQSDGLQNQVWVARIF